MASGFRTERMTHFVQLYPDHQMMSILNSRELTWSYRISFFGAAPPPPLAPAPPPAHLPPSSAAADPNRLGSALPCPVPAHRMSPPPSTAAAAPAVDRRRRRASLLSSPSSKAAGGQRRPQRPPPIIRRPSPRRAGGGRRTVTWAHLQRLFCPFCDASARSSARDE